MPIKSPAENNAISRLPPEFPPHSNTTRQTPLFQLPQQLFGFLPVCATLLFFHHTLQGKHDIAVFAVCFYG
ncbi:MAG: hypothetical protein ACR2P4_06065 [Gammaproteobacteria bacterium]